MGGLLKNLDLNDLIENAKEAFGLGPKTMWGIDLGGSSIKIADVSELGRGKYKLNHFASVKLPEGAIIEDEIHDRDAVCQAIRQCVKQAGVVGNQVCLGLSGAGTVARRLQLAGGTYEEIEDQLTWEAEQYLPFPLEECKYSFHIMGENEGGGVDVVIGAAKNDVIENAIDVLKEAGLKVKVIDLGILAMVNVFEIVGQEEVDFEGNAWILLDIGAEISQLVIYRNGLIIFSKEVAIGGVMITEEIQRQIGVNFQEAEELKVLGDGQGNAPEEVEDIIKQTVEVFVREVKKTVDFYVTSTSDDSIVGMFLTGGSSLIPGLMESFEDEMSLELHRLDPFNVFEYNKKGFKSEEIKKIGDTGVVAMGLGMRTLK